MSFVTRLVAGTFLVSACTLVVLLWGSARALRGDLQSIERTRLETQAGAVAAQLPADTTQWQAAISRMSALSGERIVVRRDGRVVAATDSLRTGPFVTAAVDRGALAVEVSADASRISDAVAHARRHMLRAAAVALLVALVLAWIAGRSIAAPLLEVTRAAGSLAQGITPRFPESRIPEVDRLVTMIREMHRHAEQRIAVLSREQAAAAALVDSMVEGIIATDARGGIVTINQAGRRLLGYAGDEPLPPLATLFRFKAARDAVSEVLAGTEVIDREVELGDVTVLLNARPLPAGGAVVVLHDLTQLRRLELVRRDFVANVSHELKTPLTSIAGYAETLADEQIEAGMRQRFVATIQANARRMQRLVDDLLDLARIESGRWTPAPVAVPVQRAAREAWSGFAERAAARDVEFVLTAEPGAEQVYADADAVDQVLCNLFDNALRHVPDRGRIAVTARREGNGTAVRVADNGSGIPAEHLPRIFERFYRVDPSRSREQGGTGLGLSIVRHMVEAHGGTVGIDSAPRQGTEVRVWFPDAPAQA